VLYMAVPSPDGRGQVLQPVQMVQLPGKQMAYVVPGGAGGLSSAAPQAPPPPVAVASSMLDNSQSMMVLPPLPSSQSHALPPDPYAMGGGLGSTTRVSNSNNNNVGAGAGAYRSNFDMDRMYMNDLGLPRGDDYGLGAGGVDGGAAGLGIGAAIAQQFQTDPAVASLYASPQRPPLDALLGQIRRLSRDQVGCRLVQQALDEEGQMAATLILQEGLPFWGEAMVDPFGNYLFQKILEKVTPDERVMLVKSVSTRLVNASLNLHGTRSVQKVVELCAVDEQNGVACKNEEEETAADILTKSLAPAAARLCIDSHGNHVIQRIILKLGSKHSEFVFDAVATSVGDVARHRHGCCVIQRCLDSPPSEARAHLVRRIVEKALELMQDAYGNYVVQYVLDVCSDDDVHAVCEAVVGRVSLLAIQKFSSNVMEKCLERCTERVKEMYMNELSDQERIRELMMDPFGNYVVQRALSVATHAQAIRLVEAMRPHLLATQTGGPTGHRNGGVRNTAGGRRIIAKICRRFPNFTLSTVGSQDEQYSRNPNNQEELYSRNKGNHRYHAAPVLAYAPVGAPTHAQQHYLGESSYMQGQLPIQQPQSQQPQSYYNLGGAPMGAPTYYDHFGTSGHGGFHGL
jgi:Pumilio-family RNA binding repeat